MSKKKNDVIPVRDGDNNTETAVQTKENKEVAAVQEDAAGENGSGKPLPETTVSPKEPEQKKAAVTRKSANELRAEEIFKSHQAVAVYFTSDGEAFLNLNFAQVHARTLKNKSIETIEKGK